MTRIDLCWPALKTTDNTNAFVSAVMHPPTQMLICAGIYVKSATANTF